jgi:MarR family transcriptional regulator, organic hydroperoxide resistance regulator
VISETGLPSIVLALHRTTHQTLHALGAALASAELTLSAAEINALANLASGALSVRQLSEATGTKPSTLTSLLDRLEHRGLLIRELDATDRRSFRISLTERGAAAAAQVTSAIAALEHDALAGLSAGQVAGYHAVITALAAASTGGEHHGSRTD